MEITTTNNDYFEYLVKEPRMWPLVFYSATLNVVISTIFKNGTSAFEAWAETTDFEIISYENKNKISEAKTCPKFITVLRDPIERTISAIHMLQLQHRRFGLNVTWENYTNLQYVFEPHLMPQSAFIPTKPIVNTKDVDYSILWDTMLPHNDVRTWNDVLHDYDLIKRLTEQNIFFYAHEGKDIIRPISKYLNIPYHRSFIGQNSFDNYGATKPKVSNAYIEYLKEVYDYDYKLIDSVKFINN